MLDSEFKPQDRFIHFDLKGAIPRIAYLEKILPMISSWGATGVLIEYEDSFPFSGNLSGLRNSTSYSVQQVEEILHLCQRNNLEVIPLIQTFGHLEFVLKHDSFRHFREVDIYPNELCPFHPNAPDLIMSIAIQVAELHPESRYLHIGADEVWHLGKCPKCQHEMDTRGWSMGDLFLSWTSKVARMIKEKYPQLKLIMWDDMMRPISSSKLIEYNMGSLVEPMIWKYEARELSLPQGLFDTFSKVFDTIWIASCFKGATGSAQFLPPIQHHIDNQLTWLSVLTLHHKKFKEIKGMVLTGWQRYDHYAVLCELLPVAVPSLALCLRVLNSGLFKQEDHEAVSQELGFSSRISVFPFPRPQILEQGMSFPGHQIYVAVQMWSNFVHKYQIICSSEGVLGWFSDYFRSKNFTNPAQVESIKFQLLELEENFVELEGHMKQCLIEVFFEDTVEEWTGCFFKPLLRKIRNMISECKTQIEVGGRIRDYKLDKNKAGQY